MLIVVTYHYVRPTFDAPFAGIHGVTPAELEAQLRTLATAGEFVSGTDVRDAVRGTAGLPPRAILVTFDDGLREQSELALPVLRRLGIPGTFFVNTQPIAQGTVSTVHKIHLLRAYTPPERFEALLQRAALARGAVVAFDRAAEGAAARQYRYDTPADARLKYMLNFQLASPLRDAVIGSCFAAVFGDDEQATSARLYMDVAQLRELGERDAVGTHGHEHVPLGTLSRVAVRHNVERSLDLLTGWVGFRPYALSYPYGSAEACTLQAVAGAADAGIELAFTTERAGNPDLSRPLHLARFDCNDLPGGKHASLRVEDLFEGTPSDSAPVDTAVMPAGDRL